MTPLFPKRGDIWLLNCDPTLGAEIRKTRPALILQNDVGNQYSPVTIVAALTSQIKPKIYPTNVLVQPVDSGLDKPSVVLLSQIRTVDKERLIKRLGTLSPASLHRVEQALRISLGLFEL